MVWIHSKGGWIVKHQYYGKKGTPTPFMKTPLNWTILIHQPTSSYVDSHRIISIIIHGKLPEIRGSSPLYLAIIEKAVRHRRQPHDGSQWPGHPDRERAGFDHYLEVLDPAFDVVHGAIRRGDVHRFGPRQRRTKRRQSHAKALPAVRCTHDCFADGL